MCIAWSIKVDLNNNIVNPLECFIKHWCICSSKWFECNTWGISEVLNCANRQSFKSHFPPPNLAFFSIWSGGCLPTRRGQGSAYDQYVPLWNRNCGAAGLRCSAWRVPRISQKWQIRFAKTASICTSALPGFFGRVATLSAVPTVFHHYQNFTWLSIGSAGILSKQFGYMGSPALGMGFHSGCSGQAQNSSGGCVSLFKNPYSTCLP